MVVQSILHFVIQECNKIETSFIFNKTKNMNQSLPPLSTQEKQTTIVMHGSLVTCM
jgi:hypothetical protein